eukprot:1553778-Prymnesium_polylepis.1
MPSSAALAGGAPLGVPLSLLAPNDLTAKKYDIGPEIIINDTEKAALRSFTENVVTQLLEHPCATLAERTSHANVAVRSLDGVSVHTVPNITSYTLKYATTVGPIVEDVVLKPDGGYALLAIETHDIFPVTTTARTAPTHFDARSVIFPAPSSPL